MAKSFANPDFRQAPYQTHRFAAATDFSSPEQAFSYKPTRFNISGSAGQGIAEAAGMVTTPENYKALSEYNPDYDTLASGLYAADQTEHRAMVDGAGGILANATRNAGLIEANKIKLEAGERDQQRSTTGGLISAGLGTALKFGMGAIFASDIETKHTIDQLEDAMSILRDLRPVTFYYKEEYSSSPERMHYGFIAQEYQKVMPDQTYFDDSIGKLCIDPVELIGVLVRAVQQLETKLTRLEAKAALVGVK